MSSGTPDLFLSYDRHDNTLVRDLAEQLSVAGVQVWFDQWELVPGSEWESEARRAMEGSAAIGICIGRRGVTQWMWGEIESYAKRRIIPILLPGANDQDLPAALASRVSVDLRDGIAPRAVKALVDATLRLGADDAPSDREVADRLLAGGDPRASLRSYEAALAASSNDLDTAAIHGGMGAALYQLGDLEQAERHLRTALDLETPLLGDSHTTVARHLSLLGNVRGATGDLAFARDVYDRLLATGNLSEREVPGILGNLGNIHLATGDLDGARSRYEDALRRAEKLEGPASPGVALQHNNLGQLDVAAGAPENAVPHFETALKGLEQAYGPDHPLVASALGNLAMALRAVGRLDDAEEACRRALEIDEATLGPRTPDVARGLSNLGTILRDKGDLIAAKDALQRATDLNLDLFGPQSPRVATNLTNLAAVHRQLGHVTEARAYAERALEIDRETFGFDHPTVATDLNNLGQVLADMGDTAGALAAMRESLGIFTRSFGAQHPYSETLRAAVATLDRQSPRPGPES
jgi:tetratricopeptide (TPR) repeat protein